MQLQKYDSWLGQPVRNLAGPQLRLNSWLVSLGNRSLNSAHRGVQPAQRMSPQ